MMVEILWCLLTSTTVGIFKENRSNIASHHVRILFGNQNGILESGTKRGRR